MTTYPRHQMLTFHFTVAIVLVVWIVFLPASCNGKGHALDSGYSVGVIGK